MKEHPPSSIAEVFAKEEVYKIYEKHAADLGHVAIAWNRLHQAFGTLFVAIISPLAESTGWAAWHAIKNDRSQRDMLMATARNALGEKNNVFTEIKWAIDQSLSLENSRNDALHSPYAVVIEDGQFKMIPEHFTGNLRALNLKDRDLKEELSSYWMRISLLGSFVSKLALFVRDPAPNELLPERPPLKRPAHAMSRKRQSKEQ